MSYAELGHGGARDRPRAHRARHQGPATESRSSRVRARSGRSPTSARCARAPSWRRSITRIRPRSAGTFSSTRRAVWSSAKTRSRPPRSSRWREQCPRLEHVVTLRRLGRGAISLRAAASWRAQVDIQLHPTRSPRAQCEPEDMATIVYTSGHDRTAQGLRHDARATAWPPRACTRTSSSSPPATSRSSCSCSCRSLTRSRA